MEEGDYHISPTSSVKIGFDRVEKSHTSWSFPTRRSWSEGRLLPLCLMLFVLLLLLSQQT